MVYNKKMAAESGAPVYVEEGTSWSAVLHHSSVLAWGLTKAIIHHQTQ